MSVGRFTGIWERGIFVHTFSFNNVSKPNMQAKLMER